MKVDKITPSNNLNTVLINSPGSKSTSVQIWFKAGSSLESKDNQGIAHFLEHMFFKGTKKYPGAKIAKTIETCGGEVNAFTSFDYTCYYINVPTAETNKAINILLDMVSNPLFLEKDLIPEREVVFEEYRRSLDNPSQFNFFKIQNGFFTGSYKHPILGNEQTIKNFSRKQLIDFRNKFYNLSNMFFVVAGDIKKPKEVETLISKYKMPTGPQTKYSKFKLAAESKVISHKKRTNQASINLVIESPSYQSEEGAIEDLALNCLTYGDTSPLYKSLVTETNFANSVGGSTLFFNSNGTHLLKLSLPIENFNKGLVTLKKELLNILQEGFSTQEIDRIRNQYIASKIYEKETIESFSFSLGHSFAQTGDLDCEDKFIDKMKVASKQDVHRALANILSRKIHISCQIPEDSKLQIDENKFNTFQDQINKKAEQTLKKFKELKFESSEFDPEVKVFKIANNVSLIYRQNSMTPTFALNTYIKGGVSEEDEKSNGIHNLIAKNLTYGHKEIKYEDLKMFLEQSSSYLNGFSGKNTYGLTLHGLTQNFSSLIPHFFNSLFHPSLPKKYLDLEKELIKRSLFLQKEDPVKVCFKKFNSLVFNKHPYRFETVGTESSLKSLTRKKILEKHLDNLNTSEIVFSYCGDLSSHYVIEKLTPFLNKLKSRPKQKLNKNKVEPILDQKISIPFQREQTHIIIGKNAPRSSTKEDIMLRMLTTYLGGQSSDLFIKVRDEMGLCYAVQPIHLPAVEAGYFGIYIGAGADKKDLAINAILKILNKLNEKGISNSEFKKIKSTMMGQNQISVQTNDDYANYYAIPYLQSLGLDYQNKTMNKIKDLPLEDFNHFLKKYLKNKWNIVEVGPEN